MRARVSACENSAITFASGHLSWRQHPPPAPEAASPCNPEGQPEPGQGSWAAGAPSTPTCRSTGRSQPHRRAEMQGWGPHPRAEVSRGGAPTPGSGRGSVGGCARTAPASGPHQQLSFRTLCSSEALARDNTIFRVSFMIAGARDPRPRPGPPPARYREDFRSAAARLHGAWPASSGACPASPLASFVRGRVFLGFGSRGGSALLARLAERPLLRMRSVGGPALTSFCSDPG